MSTIGFLSLVLLTANVTFFTCDNFAVLAWFLSSYFMQKDRINHVSHIKLMKAYQA
jgi:hypothetical protein